MRRLASYPLSGLRALNREGAVWQVVSGNGGQTLSLAEDPSWDPWLAPLPALASRLGGPCHREGVGCVCVYVCTYVGLAQGTEEDIKRVMTRINGHLFFSPV